MGLIKFWEKNVRIIDTDGQVFEGHVSDYVYPDDDDIGTESIIIDCMEGPLKGRGVEFWEKDIKSIEEIK